MFTKQQMRIVSHTEGNALIESSAGSGKTTVLIGLVANLIKNGVDPSKITILMFGESNKTEFFERLSQELHLTNSQMPVVKTYHALSLELCKFFELRGMLPTATLETSSFRYEMFASSVLKEVMSKIGSDHFEDPKDKEKVLDLFLNFIDLTKSGFDTAEVSFEKHIKKERLKFLVKAFEMFEELRKERKVRYFADLIYDVVLQMKSKPEMVDIITNRKKYVIVDEFQDTNDIQYQLLKYIAGHTANVIVAGDIDQLIFSWRGSNTEIMSQKFIEDFKPIIYPMSKSFRFGHKIALASNYLISNNKIKKIKQCTAFNGDQKSEINFINSLEENAIVNKISSLVGSGTQLNDIGVVCRTYSTTVDLELELAKRSIPYKNYGKSAFNSSEIENLNIVLMLASGKFSSLNEHERTAYFEKLLAFPSKRISKVLRTKICEKMGKRSSGFHISINDFTVSAKEEWQLKNIRSLAKHIEPIEKSSKLLASTVILDFLSNSSLFKELAKDSANPMYAEEKKERILSYLSFVKNNDATPEVYLEKYKEIQDRTQFANRKDKKHAGITIMSVHKAKGLQFKFVFIPKMVQGKFPYISENTYHIESEIDSERRLAYVAMTRAISELYIETAFDSNFVTYRDKGIAPKDYMFQNGKDRSSQFVFEMSVTKTNNVCELINKNDINRLMKDFINDEIALSYSNDMLDCA